MSSVASTAPAQQTTVSLVQPPSNPVLTVAHRALADGATSRSNDWESSSVLIGMVVFGGIAALLYFYSAITLGVIVGICLADAMIEQAERRPRWDGALRTFV